MVEAGSVEGAKPPAQPDAATPVSQADLDRFRSVYDTKVSDLTKQVEEAKHQIAEAKAETESLRLGATADTLKLVEREANLRRKELLVEASVQKLAADELKLFAAQTAADAKATWGIELSVDELVKLGNKADIALTALRKATEAKPKSGKPYVASGGQQSSPAQPRYEPGNLGAGIERYLREQGRMP